MYIIGMPGKSYSGPFQPLSLDETELRDRLKIHVSLLADPRRWTAVGQLRTFGKDLNEWRENFLSILFVC